MLGQGLLIFGVSLFLGLMLGLFLLVVLQLFLILFLLQLVINISIGVVVIDLLVVVADCFVVVVNLLIVVADCFVVILCVHAVGVGHLGRVGHIQIGISQEAFRVFFVLAGDGIVVLLGLIIVFDGFFVLVDGLIVGLLDLVVVAAGHDLCAHRLVVDFNFVHGQAAVQDFGIVQFRCLSLSGQCNGHRHSNSNSAANLGQELLVILLSHNFNLLFIIERLKYWRPGCHGVSL